MAPVGRTIAIGDIHGCSKAIRALLEAVEPQSDDTFVLLGDYVDRGPDSRGVIDVLLELQQTARVVPLRGNHELMMLSVKICGLPAEPWLLCGGQATLASYGGQLTRIPDAHLEFLASLRPYYETPTAIFVHAGYVPELPMDQQPEQALYWDHLPPFPPRCHISGKRVFVGHTPQGSGRPLNLGHLVCLDTYCFGGLWLSAMDVDTGQLWQASPHGHMRRQVWGGLFHRCRHWLMNWRDEALRRGGAGTGP